MEVVMEAVVVVRGFGEGGCGGGDGDQLTQLVNGSH